jgi:hypothetical protein
VQQQRVDSAKIVAATTVPSCTAKLSPGHLWGPLLKWLKDHRPAAGPSNHASGAKRLAHVALSVSDPQRSIAIALLQGGQQPASITLDAASLHQGHDTRAAAEQSLGEVGKGDGRRVLHPLPAGGSRDTACGHDLLLGIVWIGARRQGMSTVPVGRCTAGQRRRGSPPVRTSLSGPVRGNLYPWRTRRAASGS